MTKCLKLEHKHLRDFNNDLIMELVIKGQNPMCLT